MTGDGPIVLDDVHDQPPTAAQRELALEWYRKYLEQSFDRLPGLLHGPVYRKMWFDPVDGAIKSRDLTREEISK